MGKKKKKDLDFQKVKLKIGRKIKRQDRETKAEFSTRKIVLKEVRRYSDDPISALSKNSPNISHQGKLSLLNHFRAALKPDIVKSLTKPILDSLTKFTLDSSSDVRTASFRCLKTIFHHLKTEPDLLRDYVSNLKPYLNCAYTHVSKGLESDCHDFMKFLIDQNESATFEPLMAIMLARIRAGNLEAKDKAIALDLRRFYTRNRLDREIKQSMCEADIVKLDWQTSRDNFLNLDTFIHKARVDCIPYRIGQDSNLNELDEDIPATFLNSVQDFQPELSKASATTVAGDDSGNKRLRRF